MKLDEFFKTENLSGGLPEGDTYLDLEDIEIEKTKFKDDKGIEKDRYFLHKKEEKEGFYISKIVLLELKKHIGKAKRVRITRNGTGQKDTRYTVACVD